MVDRDLDLIAGGDIKRLQTNEVPESRTLEYKLALPGFAEKDRKEFLADISAMANGAGGDVVYGVRESNGQPVEIRGVVCPDQDAEALRLDSILRDGLQPRIRGLRMKWVPNFQDGPVLVIRVPRSWTGPHMVTFQSSSRFYVRAGAAKHLMDVFELRTAFLESGDLAARARALRDERLGRLLAGERPASITGSKLLCIHAIPHVALSPSFEIDLLLAANQREFLEPIRSSGWSDRFNLDGFLTYSPRSDGTDVSYVQVFRNGVLETATAAFLSGGRPDPTDYLPSVALAKELAGFVGRVQRLMPKIGIDPPLSIFVSILGVKDAQLRVSSHWTFSMGVNLRPFDREHLLLSEVAIERWDADPWEVIRPALDQLWQAAGAARSFDYNDEGQWRPHQ